MWAAFAITILIVMAGVAPASTDQHLLPGVLRRAGGLALVRSHTSLIVAFVVVLCVSLAIRKEPVKGSAMQSAWLLIAIGCAIALGRFIFELTFILLNPASPASPLIGLRQIPNALSSFVVLAGLVVMWLGFF